MYPGSLRSVKKDMPTEITDRVFLRIRYSAAVCLHFAPVVSSAIFGTSPQGILYIAVQTLTHNVTSFGRCASHFVPPIHLLNFDAGLLM